MEYSYIDKPDALAHYGVLGMKWGVRKRKSSQNKPTILERYRHNKKQSEIAWDFNRNYSSERRKARRANYDMDKAWNNAVRTTRERYGLTNAELYKARNEAYKHDMLVTGVTAASMCGGVLFLSKLGLI